MHLCTSFHVLLFTFCSLIHSKSEQNSQIHKKLAKSEHLWNIIINSKGVIFMNKENIDIEFKREFNDDVKKSLKQEVVAFANASGGTLYIGIDDEGNEYPLDNISETLTQITNSIRDSILPDVTIFTTAKIVDNHIEIKVAEGTNKPYYIKENGLKPSGVYIRQGNSKAQASPDQIRYLIKLTDGDKFEDMRSLVQNLTFVEAEREFANRHVEFGRSQMKTLGLIDGAEQYTNLALLLSDQCTHTIKIAVFQGNNKTEFKNRKEFGGSVLKQLHDSYDFISLNNNLPATFSGLDRIENYDYPDDALREALLNAIIHRDYAFSGSIIVNIFDDRIEFVSLGGLVEGITKEDIMLGVSQTRNEKLADVFYRLKHVEAFGTGIQKILTLYDNQERKPNFIISTGTVVTELPNTNYLRTLRANRHPTRMQHSRIIDYIEENGSITKPEVEMLLGVKRSRSYTIIKEMIDLSLIVQSGDKYLKNI